MFHTEASFTLDILLCNSDFQRNILDFFLIDPFHASDLFLYPLKTSENQKRSINNVTNTSKVLSEAYAEPCQTSKMEQFAKIVNE